MNKFEDMQIFIRIVDAGSITRAASQLNTAKSAISKRLSTLEQKLGLTLLNRTTRSQILTENGRLYYQQCQRILDDVNEMESSIQNKLCALSGNIKISVPLSFGLLHLGTAINKFNEIHQAIQLEIDFNDRKVDIINEGYDLAIRIGQLQDSNLMATKITSSQIMLVASPHYLGKHGMPKTPSDLQNNHVKLHYSNTPGGLMFKKNNQKTISVNLPNIMVSNNGDFLCQAAVDGKGLIKTPDFICYKYVRSGQLVAVLQDYSPVENSLGVYAIYPQTKHLSRRVRMLINFFKQYFGEQPYWQIN